MERKEAILVLLKVRGEATLAELAERMQVTKQGALRHVETLEARGLIERVSDAQPHEGPGRPEHRYRLTAAAAELFPHAHRQLASELVDFMESDQLDRFFKARAERLEREYAVHLAGLDFEARVRELARLASEAGHMTEVVETADGGLALRHCNCPIQDVAAKAGHPCRHEQDMYERLLGAAVERTAWMAGQNSQHDTSCTYEIKPR
ncbi:MAG TPA: MarR family transcriptional regulator [Candidatus Dormibacteraeota bacterium]